MPGTTNSPSIAPASTDAAIAKLAVLLEEGKADDLDAARNASASYRELEAAIESLLSLYSPEDRHRLRKGRMNDQLDAILGFAKSISDDGWVYDIDRDDEGAESAYALIEAAAVGLHATKMMISHRAEPLDADTVERLILLTAWLRAYTTPSETRAGDA